MMLDKSLPLQPGRTHSVDLKATVVSTNGIREIEPEARGCFFTDESNLEFYKGYTFSNCRLECSILEAEKMHKCVPWHLPKVGFVWAKRLMMKRDKTHPLAILGLHGTSRKTCDWTLHDANIASRVLIPFWHQCLSWLEDLFIIHHWLSDCNHITYMPRVTSAKFRSLFIPWTGVKIHPRIIIINQKSYKYYNWHINSCNYFN